MKKIWSVILIIIVLILIVSFGIYRQKRSAGNELEKIDFSDLINNPKENIPTIQVETEDGKKVTIEQIPIEDDFDPTIEAPDLNKSVNFNNLDYTKDRKATLLEKISELRAILKKQPSNFDVWIELGLYYKTAGDYEKAIEVWTYTAKLRPYQSISFLNLGTIYGYYLKDNILAEKYYLQAIEAEPNLGINYIQTYQFYTEVLDNEKKAVEIIELGVKNNPDDEEMKLFLENIK